VGREGVVVVDEVALGIHVHDQPVVEGPEGEEDAHLVPLRSVDLEPHRPVAPA
jgi:hypothetical protein